ncbi:MAG: DNA-binding response regulator, partial [Myxococcales bacterium]|nr:DNA-binding response regulator [Myxococcales bacterium]
LVDAEGLRYRAVEVDARAARVFAMPLAPPRAEPTMDAKALQSKPSDTRSPSTPAWTAPWRETLLRFEVPFVWLSPGACAMASPAAHALFHEAYDDEQVPAEVERLGTESAGTWIGGGELLRNVPTVDGRFDLAVYAPSEVPESRVVVVTVRSAAAIRVTHGALTRREAEVATLIASGRPTKQIAGCLSISTHTARHHTERVFEKLGVRSRAAVAALVFGHGQQLSPETLTARRA